MGTYADHRWQPALQIVLCHTNALPADCSHGDRPLRSRGGGWIVAGIAQVRPILHAARAHACAGIGALRGCNLVALLQI